MQDITITNPLDTAFLKEFTFNYSSLPFTDDEISGYDSQLNKYEIAYLNPDIGKNLISKNELLVSFAISKAENSSLTLQEAEDIYQFIINNLEFDFISKKIKQHKKLTVKDYEKLEFFNIAKTFRLLSSETFKLEDFTTRKIKEIHKLLTNGLDIFTGKISNFTVYKSGLWRDNDSIHVDSYIPAPSKTINTSMKWLINWLKGNFSISNIGIFYAGMYAIHPFNNGNKRVCRILEHLLLKEAGLNKKNIYSTSYYYHKEKQRYYKYLFYSLSRKNLNDFTAFMQEAIVLSIADVFKTGIEVQKNNIIKRMNLNEKLLPLIKLLIKHPELQYKKMWNMMKRKMTNKTFVAYLKNAVESGIFLKREQGKNTYYSLKIKLEEEKYLAEMIRSLSRKLPYLPGRYMNFQP
jgi:Fic family protein